FLGCRAEALHRARGRGRFAAGRAADGVAIRDADRAAATGGTNMRVEKVLTICTLTLAAASVGHAQERPGAAFTTTGTRCSDVQWSPEALAQYPRIATACREVMQRDGKYYVRFEGEVQRVADRGQQLTIDFRDGDRLTVTPPENLSVTIDGRPTAARDLRPGDELTFYVPQDQLAVSFF